MHPKTELKSFCLIFARIGLSSVQPYIKENASNQNILLWIPTFIQAVILIFEFWFVLTFPNEIFHSATSVGTFTDIVQVFGILIAGMVQILENVWKNGNNSNLKLSIEDFDREIFAKHACQNSGNCSFCQKRSLKPYLISRTINLLVVGLVIDVAIMVTLRYQPKQDVIWQQSICVREFTANMIRIGLIQVALHFHWVRHFNMNYNYSNNINRV